VILCVVTSPTPQSAITLRLALAVFSFLDVVAPELKL
jgi:hypothetical protein